jgi:excisionase family DNA binding protein
MTKLSEDLRSKLLELSLKKQFLSVIEASAYTGFSIKYLYQLVHQRAIPFYKPGRKLFFKISELDSWITNSRNKTFEEIEKDAIDGISSL